ncbi:hypothetical protein MAPG_11488 [Magnaporthiopsis poae ATCC 64411]|uniref:NADH:flavin oxidoreductase/NADH oxidase N-terminal domain-containing protein n=1 Tax=Magnaporthiopsis poae (strain ATCC 64411 / 73-15) TaxID=644358 RepID=A0A0C4EFE5_MAGP6|nr:hypothetical protein MAPG_11488 [Magnaporthiopsis poae ATCC 64411]
MTRLFSPIRVGRTPLTHRISMAPLTRFRNTDDFLPIDPIVKEYYEQRASVPGTLIISEATLISPTAGGYTTNVPGIWSDAQVSAWRPITDAVHAKGSFIYCQLWHEGRAGLVRPKGPTDSSEQATPKTVLYSSSAVPIRPGAQAPEAMTEDQIRQTIADYAAAARNAIAAGFDGVEIHGANGYLPDQFLQDVCNRRTDDWGGSIENRARFHLEVTKAVAAAVGPQRVGMRLSPYSDFGGMLMEDPDPTFHHLVSQLRQIQGLAYLHLIEARISGPAETDCGSGKSVDWLVELWDNASPVLLAGGFTPGSAKKAVDERFAKYDVVIVFGRSFVPNPDLVYRVREGIDLVKHDRSVFYTPKLAKGYTDFPFSSQFLAAAGGAE